MKIKKEIVFGSVFILFALWIIWQTGFVSEKLVSNEPGPRLFPYIAGIGIIVCSVLMMIFDGNNSRKDHAQVMSIETWKKVGLFFGELIGFGILIYFLGFFVSSLVLLPTLIFTLKGEKKVNLLFVAILTVGLTCLIFFGFTKGFSIPLPTGVLWDAIGFNFSN